MLLWLFPRTYNFGSNISSYFKFHIFEQQKLSAMEKYTKFYPIVCLLLLICTVNIGQAQCENRSRSGIHVVQKGETLYRIALRYELSVADLKEMNNISSNGIYVCQELIVDTQSSPDAFDYPEESTILWEESAGTTEKPYSEYKIQAGGTHVVGIGETIANIARLYGYTEARFRKFNKLTSMQKVPAGFSLRSTDCVCERVEEYATTEATRIRPANNSGRRYEPSTLPDNRTENTPRYEKDPNDLSDYYRPSGQQTPQYPSPSTRVEGISTTVVGANYMRAEEKSMIDEINLLRSNPAAYIPYVEAYIEDIKAGRSFSQSPAAAYELIDELKRTGPLSMLQATECLYRAAEAHGQEAVLIGRSEHQGEDGSWPWDRVRRACPNMQDGNENLVGGPSDIRTAMLLLLIDDGIPNRGHRRTLLKADWKYVACYKSGQVGRMPNSWIQLFGS